jgi:hypothetical protein
MLGRSSWHRHRRRRSAPDAQPRRPDHERTTRPTAAARPAPGRRSWPRSSARGCRRLPPSTANRSTPRWPGGQATAQRRASELLDPALRAAVSGAGHAQRQIGHLLDTQRNAAAGRASTAQQRVSELLTAQRQRAAQIMDMVTPLLDRAGVPAEVTKRFSGRRDLPAGDGHETADGPSAASGTATATATPASPSATASGTKASQA